MYKVIGGVPIQPVHRASCHCGAVRLEVELPDGVVDPRRCDCSLCRRKGTIVATVPLHRLRVAAGREHLRLYQLNTMTARHWFCGICGIHTHHQRRSDPNEYGFNVACLEGISILSTWARCRPATASTIPPTARPAERPGGWPTARVRGALQRR